MWQLPTSVLGALGGGLSGGVADPQPGPKDGTMHINGPFDVPATFGPVMWHPKGEVMSEATAAHEEVHKLQSKILGPLYIPVVILGYVGGAIQYVGGGFTSGASFRDFVHDANPLEWAADLGSGNAGNIRGNKFLRWISPTVTDMAADLFE